MPDEPAADGDGRTEAPTGEAAGSDEGASGHDPTGLEAARSLASGVRRTASKQRTARRERRSGRAVEPEFSGARPDARDPALLGSALEQLLADRGWDRQVADHAVFARWAQIVGAEVAAHCAPERLADARLTIRADSTAWATQLRLLAPNVVARINEVLGDGSVARIEVLGPAAPSWRHGRRSVRGARGPGDTYG